MYFKSIELSMSRNKKRENYFVNFKAEDFCIECNQHLRRNKEPLFYEN